VLALVIAAIETACEAVSLPTPLPLEAPSSEPVLTALIPLMDESRCVYIAVGAAQPSSLAAAAGVGAEDAADLLAELTNMLAGISSAGTEFSLGLPVVFEGVARVAPPAQMLAFSTGSAEFVLGVWG
jgi:uncharacterized membrane protein